MQKRSQSRGKGLLGAESKKDEEGELIGGIWCWQAVPAMLGKRREEKMRRSHVSEHVRCLLAQCSMIFHPSFA